MMSSSVRCENCGMQFPEVPPRPVCPFRAREDYFRAVGCKTIQELDLGYAGVTVGAAAGGPSKGGKEVVAVRVQVGL